MRKKMIILLFLLALSLCICMVTNVLSLFPGTHTLIDMSSDDNDISCTGCHGEIQKQLSNSSIHLDFDCEDCHRFGGTGIVFAARTQSGYQIGDQAHAAYTPQCLDCHGEGGYATQASAFNESGYGSKASAHRPLVVLALDCNLSVGENEACIACHTNYSITNVFMRPEYFDFLIKESSGTGGSGGDWYVDDDISYGTTNTTPVFKRSESGAKHEFKAINQIKCEECHYDVWQAANHTELNNYSLPNASHVCWKWGGYSEHGECGRKSKSGESPMHNVEYVYSEYVGFPSEHNYTNITEFCTLSCHKPIINPEAEKIPPVFQETAHAAYRISCYHCHNSSTYTDAIWNKTKPDWDTPGFFRGGEGGCGGDKHEGHDNLDDSALSKPLFLSAETCISCKRGSCQSCHPASGGGKDFPHFKTWTEPNNTMYHYDKGYI